MLVFDQLNKADRPLRVLSWLVALGLGVLLGGLWWVQIVRYRHYAADQRTQSYRTVRVPAPRGKIMDRHGTALAENRPSYNISLYLEDRTWRESVRKKYREMEQEARGAAWTNREPNRVERMLSVFGYKPNLAKSRRLTQLEVGRLSHQARYLVTSNIVWELGSALGQALVVDEKKFHKHYLQKLALPMPLISNLDSNQIARFQERAINLPGVEMDIQPTRVYPQGELAAHVLGHLTRNDEPAGEESLSYNYFLPDYRGLDGIEASYDEQLRGRAGAKSVLVNNLGYRQSETVITPVEHGQHVTLTIDADVQRVAENALRAASAAKPVRGAAVVLDVQNGEILALASAPSFDPNDWIPYLPQNIWNTYTNEDVAPLQNRAVYGHYMPGSTFKIVVALAGLEAGTLDPSEFFHVEPNPHDPHHGIIYVGPRRHSVKDTAPPGDYQFRRAFIKSSNSYFVTNGLRMGPERIVSMAERMQFGQRAGIPLRDSRGLVPTQEWMRDNRGGWSPPAIANLCIGQGDLDVTPLQVAVAVAAVANGGHVLSPQLVMSVRGFDELVPANAGASLSPVVRDELRVRPQDLEVVRQAMLADVEDPDGTGKAARVDGYRVCGKTGTAQVFKGERFDHYTVWFASYAPFESPRYAVVVMVDYGSSGGGTCAPVAKKIYAELQRRDQRQTTLRKEAFVRN